MDEKKIVTEVHSMTEEEMESLGASLANLKEQEQNVLTLAYGLDGEERRTVKEIKNITGLSESSVNRFRTKGKNHLKQMLGIDPIDNETIDAKLEQFGESKRAGR